MALLVSLSLFSAQACFRRDDASVTAATFPCDPTTHPSPVGLAPTFSFDFRSCLKSRYIYSSVTLVQPEPCVFARMWSREGGYVGFGSRAFTRGKIRICNAMVLSEWLLLLSRDWRISWGIGFRGVK